MSDTRIQDAMVEHFTQVDGEYGRLVKEGIGHQIKEMKEEKSDYVVLGRDSSQTKFGQGTPASTKAVEDAVKKGNQADPY